MLTSRSSLGQRVQEEEQCAATKTFRHCFNQSGWLILRIYRIHRGQAVQYLGCKWQRAVSSIPGYSRLFQPIPVHSSIPVCSNLAQPIPAYSCLFHPIPSYSSLFQPIPAYSILFQKISKSPISHAQPPISNLKCPIVHFIHNWTFCLLVLY